MLRTNRSDGCGALGTAAALVGSMDNAMVASIATTVARYRLRQLVGKGRDVLFIMPGV